MGNQLICRECGKPEPDCERLGECPAGMLDRGGPV